MLLLGVAEIQRGVDLTAKIIETTSALGGEAKQFVVRAIENPGASIQIRGALDNIKHAISSVMWFVAKVIRGRAPIKVHRALGDIRRVTPHVIEETMGEQEFLEFLTTADIIVLLYRSTAFAERTSGLLIDALILSKPVVVFKGTWLAEIVEKYHCGLAVKDGDVSAMAAAVLTIENDLKRFQRAASAARESYISDNIWDALASKLLEVKLHLGMPGRFKWRLREVFQFVKSYLIKLLIRSHYLRLLKQIILR